MYFCKKVFFLSIVITTIINFSILKSSNTTFLLGIGQIIGMGSAPISTELLASYIEQQAPREATVLRMLFQIFLARIGTKYGSTYKKELLKRVPPMLAKFCSKTFYESFSSYDTFEELEKNVGKMFFEFSREQSRNFVGYYCMDFFCNFASKVVDDSSKWRGKAAFFLVYGLLELCTSCLDKAKLEDQAFWLRFIALIFSTSVSTLLQHILHIPKEYSLRKELFSHFVTVLFVGTALVVNIIFEKISHKDKRLPSFKEVKIILYRIMRHIIRNQVGRAALKVLNF
jgi:hypothetical protein